MICGIILAAGESKRMGCPKQLLPFGNQTLIEVVLEHALQSRLDEVTVVLGSHRESIAEKLARYPVSMVFNSHYRNGMLSSVQCGFEAMAKDATAAIIILGDQPTIPKEVIDSIIDAYHGSGKGIVLPIYQNRRGHPVLIDCKYRNEVADLDPAVGLRALIHEHPEDVEEVAVELPAILKDIDYPEDYLEEFQKQENGTKRQKKEES